MEARTRHGSLCNTAFSQFLNSHWFEELHCLQVVGPLAFAWRAFFEFFLTLLDLLQYLIALILYSGYRLNLFNEMGKFNNDWLLNDVFKNFALLLHSFKKQIFLNRWFVLEHDAIGSADWILLCNFTYLMEYWRWRSNGWRHVSNVLGWLCLHILIVVLVSPLSEVRDLELPNKFIGVVTQMLAVTLGSQIFF